MTSENFPLVSVICLSYNHEMFVERCFLSLLSQTYKNFEIIYFDNQSKDDSFEKGKAVLSRSGISYHALKMEKNLGISNAMNLAIKEFARGKYIATLSCDDFWDIYNLEKKVAFFEQHPDNGMLYGNGYYYEDDTKEIRLYYKKPSISGWILRELMAGPSINPLGIFYRHDVMKEVGYFDGQAKVEDRDLWYRIARKYPIGYIHEPLTFYRVHSSNISSNIEYMREGNEYFFKKYENEFPKEIRSARMKQEQFFAFVLSKNNPGPRSFFKILANYKANWPYTKEVVRSFLRIFKH